MRGVSREHAVLPENKRILAMSWPPSPNPRHTPRERFGETMNEKYIAEFDEGVKAGLDGRPMTVTYVRDVTDEVWNGLAIKTLNIKLQAKQRAKNPNPAFAYGMVNDGEVKVSDLLARTVTSAPPTKEQSVTIISQLPLVERVRTMAMPSPRGMGLPVTSVQNYLDHQLEKNAISSDEHEKACDALTEIEMLVDSLDQ